MTRDRQSVSDQALVRCGVAQTSILGPLYFTIYINDLSLALQQAKCNLDADDPAITVHDVSIDAVVRKLNIELEGVTQWFYWNKLSKNFMKATYMLFGTRPKLATVQNLPVKYEHQILEKVREFKYLRVKLDQFLTFTNLDNYIKAKVIGKI